MPGGFCLEPEGWNKGGFRVSGPPQVPPAQGELRCKCGGSQHILRDLSVCGAKEHQGLNMQSLKNGGKGHFFNPSWPPASCPEPNLTPSAQPRSKGCCRFDGGFCSEVLTQSLLHMGLGNTFYIAAGSSELSGMGCGSCSVGQRDPPCPAQRAQCCTASKPLVCKGKGFSASCPSQSGFRVKADIPPQPNAGGLGRSPLPMPEPHEGGRGLKQPPHHGCQVTQSHQPKCHRGNTVFLSPDPAAGMSSWVLYKEGARQTAPRALPVQGRSWNTVPRSLR